MTIKATPLSIALFTALTSNTVFATAENNQTEQQSIEVITVKSDFRQQNLQKTASSLSVLTAQDIKQRNAQHLEELIVATPNVNFASGSQRARFYQIRGIGERSQFNEPINPSVGVMVDDIDFSGIGSIASTFDVAQTEIYRGPQGTRFGANAMAGLINIQTHAPSDEFEGEVQLNAGNYHSYGAGIVLSGPATNAVKYRIGVQQHNSDGFIKNTTLNRTDTNNRDEFTLRGKLAIRASDELNIDLALYYFDFDNGYDAFSLDNNRTTLSDQPGFDQQDTKALSSKLTYTGLAQADVIAIFSHADSDLAYGYDEDWSFAGLCQQNDCPWGDYSSTDHYFRDRQTSTGELRLVSKPGQQLLNQQISWVAGLYIKHDDESLIREYTYLDSDFSSAFTTSTVAAYGQLDNQLTQQLTLTTGLRVEQRRADYLDSAMVMFEPKDTMVGGKVVLAYQQNDEVLWYGQINRGYKAGGVNTNGDLPENLRAFDPEYLWNYELGYKISFNAPQAYVRTAIFYMDRTDMQASVSKTTLHDDGSSEFLIYFDNAAKGINNGIEIDGAWYINHQIELYGAFGLLDTRFVDFTNANGELLSGRDQAHAPNYQFTVGVNYQPTAQWLFNIGIDGKDDFYFSDSHDQQADKVTLVNASVSYLANNWQVKLWARNLSDEDYATRGFYFGNDPRDSYTAKGYRQLAEPMVVGATVNYQF